MKILIVNRFFGGAHIPTGRMAEDVARLLVERGHEVVALASSGEYAGAVAQARDEKSKRPKDKKTLGGQRTEDRKQTGTLHVEQVRVPKRMPRALVWLWFTWEAWRRIPRMDWDVCVLMTDPPLLPLLAAKVASGGWRVTSHESGEAEKRQENRTTASPKHRAKRRVAVWLMDLYPEALAASGRIARNNPFYKWYFNKRQRALGSADLLICLGQRQRELVETGRLRQTASSIRPTRIAVVPPWDDRGNIALASEQSLKNLVLYAGNLGEAHCFEEILAAAPYLPGDWTIRFAVRGAKLAALRAKTKNLSHGLRGLNTEGVRAASPTGPRESAHAVGPKALAVSPPSEEAMSQGARVEVTGYATEEETPGLLASARVHLITMSLGWEGIVVPSKLYGCIRTGRPVLFIGPETADTALEIRAHDWGQVLPPSASGEQVAEAILDLAKRPTACVQIRNGAQLVAESLESLI